MNVRSGGGLNWIKQIFVFFIGKNLKWVATIYLKYKRNDQFALVSLNYKNNNQINSVKRTCILFAKLEKWMKNLIIDYIKLCTSSACCETSSMVRGPSSRTTPYLTRRGTLALPGIVNGVSEISGDLPEWTAFVTNMRIAQVCKRKWNCVREIVLQEQGGIFICFLRYRGWMLRGILVYSNMGKIVIMGVARMTQFRLENSPSYTDAIDIKTHHLGILMRTNISETGS